MSCRRLGSLLYRPAARRWSAALRPAALLLQGEKHPLRSNRQVREAHADGVADGAGHGRPGG